MSSLKTFVMNDDSLIEIHKNNSLSSKPYLLRIYSWYNRVEIRVDNNDLQSLIEAFSELITFSEAIDKTDSCGMLDSNTLLEKKDDS